RTISGEELQIALLGDSVSGPVQAEAFRIVVATARERLTQAPTVSAPLRVDPLPADISLDQALALGKPSGSLNLHALVGVGGDELSPWWVDLSEEGPGFLIAGQPESGKSTA